METEQKIYLGPNNRKYGLLRNTVFLNGLPGYVVKAVSEIDGLDLLIVPVSEIHAVNEKIARKGTPEHKVYEMVAGIK